jgi:hypothetical protein
MSKSIDQKLAVGRNPGKTVSQSLARKMLNRSAISSIAAVVLLPIASFSMLATMSVPAYAQAAGECRTANDDATIKAMQDLIASLDAELPNLQGQLTTAEADAKDVQAQIDALNQAYANGERPDPSVATELSGKLADALYKVADIKARISNDEGHKARAEAVLKALLAKKPCLPPAITDAQVPVVPGTEWPQLVEWIRFNNDGTETWHWKDGHEVVRTRTGIVPPAVDSHVARPVEPPKTVELPKTVERPKTVELPKTVEVPKTRTVTLVPHTQTVTPVTHTTPTETTHRTVAMTAPSIHPGRLASDHAPMTIGRSMPTPSTALRNFASVAPMHTVGSPMAMPRMAMPRMGGFGKIR